MADICALPILLMLSFIYVELKRMRKHSESFTAEMKPRFDAVDKRWEKLDGGRDA